MAGFRYGTPILMGDNTYKQIQDIKQNDYVMSYDEETKTFIPQVVVYAVTTTCKEAYKYTFADGKEIIGCDELKFLSVENGYSICDVGNTIISLTGVNRIVSKEPYDDNGELFYDLDIEDIDNFIVNDVVVHNLPVSGCWVGFKMDMSSPSCYLFSATSLTGTKTYKGQLTYTSTYTISIPVSKTYYYFLSSTATTYNAISEYSLSSATTNGNINATATRQNATTFKLTTADSIVGGGTSSNPGATVLITLTSASAETSNINIKFNSSSIPSTSMYLWKASTYSGTKTYVGKLSASNLTVTASGSITTPMSFFLSSSSSSYSALTSYKIVSLSAGSLHTTNSFSVNFAGTTSVSVQLGVVPQHTSVYIPYIASLNGDGFMPVPYASATSASVWVQEKAPGASYGFTFNGLLRGRTTTPTVASGTVPSGYYAPTNANVNSTSSVMRVYVQGASGKTLTIKYLQSSEQNYDYGLISNLDSALTVDSTADSTVGKTLKGVTATTTPTSYTIAISNNNVHFVDLKYRKDTSTSSG